MQKSREHWITHWRSDMKKFDDWWHGIYIDRPKMIHRQCYEEGYEQGRSEVLGAVLVGCSSLATAIVVVALFVNYVL